MGTSARETVMTDVLVLVYLAGVAEAIGVACAIVFSVAAIAVIAGGIICHAEDCLPKFFAFLRKAAPWLIAVALIGTFTPSKTLLYVAAGLRASEEVASTPLAQKALSVIDEQLDDLLSDDEK